MLDAQSDPVVAGRVYTIVTNARNYIRVCHPPQWFPIPAYHCRLRLYRGILVGAKAPDRGSPVWSYCRQADYAVAHVFGGALDLTNGNVFGGVTASKHGDLRDFLNGRDPPSGVQKMVQSKLVQLAAAGAQSFDNTPLVIHAIEDAGARRIARQAFSE